MNTPFPLKSSASFGMSQLFSIEQLTLPEDKCKVEISVPHVKGLKVVISNVSKTFMFRAVFKGKKISTTLGKYPEVSLQQVISIVDSYQLMLSKGINPLEEKARIENIPKLADFFYKVYMPMAKLNKKSWKDDVSRFKIQESYRTHSREYSIESDYSSNAQ